MSAGPRDADAEVRWVPVKQLSGLARALLSEQLGDDDVVPEHVARRATALAGEWSAHGFTHDTVRPWADLPPAAAAYLAGRGVDPAVLDEPVELSPAQVAPITFRRAIASGKLTVEHAVNLLAGVDPGEPDVVTAPATRTRAVPAVPAAAEQAAAADQAAAAEVAAPEPPTGPPRPAPALFSHSDADRVDPEDAEQRRSIRPSQTPFRPQTGS